MTPNLNLVFLNRSFDKKRLKACILWFRLNLSEGAAIEVVESLQGLGFRSATKGAISLGLDDLKTPASKSSRVFQAQMEVALAHHEHHRGNRTPVELFQHLVDTWHRTSQDLTAECVQLFHSTERVNPVYMMAFSGARGNLSQVRQLVGMRGLMADPRGQIVGFPILSNFREGLTITEYFVSCYGARKGVVDTAIRTADAGYLTRRLADVSHHVVVRATNCGTHRGICLRDIKEGQKTILPLANRLVGRVLAEQIPKLASRNEEITPDLASKIAKKRLEVSVRSPLSCSLRLGVCQLCYGWGLAEGRRVTLGEAVGIIAAQSIGEPGTQLTLRTFHTGGVFSGDLLNEVRAPYNGTIFFPEPLQGLLVRTPHGQIAFLTKVSGKMVISSGNVWERSSTSIDSNDSINDKSIDQLRKVNNKNKTDVYAIDVNPVRSKKDQVDTVKQPDVPINKVDSKNKSKEDQRYVERSEQIHYQEFVIQPSTVIFVRQQEQVYYNQLLAEFSQSTFQPTNDQIEVTQQVLSETAGQVWFKEVHSGNRKGPGSGSLGTNFSSQKLGSVWVLAGKPAITSTKQLFMNLSTALRNPVDYHRDLRSQIDFINNTLTAGNSKSYAPALSGLQPRQLRMPEVLIDEINRLLPHPVQSAALSGATLPDNARETSSSPVEQVNRIGAEPIAQTRVNQLDQVTRIDGITVELSVSELRETKKENLLDLLTSPMRKELVGCFVKHNNKNGLALQLPMHSRTSLIDLHHDYQFIKYHYSLGYFQSIKSLFSEKMLLSVSTNVDLAINFSETDNPSVVDPTLALRAQPEGYKSADRLSDYAGKSGPWNLITIHSLNSSGVVKKRVDNADLFLGKPVDSKNTSLIWWLPKRCQTNTPGMLLDSPFFSTNEKKKGQLFWLSSYYLSVFPSNSFATSSLMAELVKPAKPEFAIDSALRKTNNKVANSIDSTDASLCVPTAVPHVLATRAMSGLQPRQLYMPEVLIDEINRLLPHHVVATSAALHARRVATQTLPRVQNAPSMMHHPTELDHPLSSSFTGLAREVSVARGLLAVTVPTKEELSSLLLPAKPIAHLSFVTTNVDKENPHTLSTFYSTPLTLFTARSKQRECAKFAYTLNNKERHAWLHTNSGAQPINTSLDEPIGKNLDGISGSNVWVATLRAGRAAEVATTSIDSMNLINDKSASCNPVSTQQIDSVKRVNRFDALFSFSTKCILNLSTSDTRSTSQLDYGLKGQNGKTKSIVFHPLAFLFAKSQPSAQLGHAMSTPVQSAALQPSCSARVASVAKTKQASSGYVNRCGATLLTPLTFPDINSKDKEGAQELTLLPKNILGTNKLVQVLDLNHRKTSTINRRIFTSSHYSTLSNHQDSPANLGASTLLMQKRVDECQINRISFHQANFSSWGNKGKSKDKFKKTVKPSSERLSISLSTKLKRKCTQQLRNSLDKSLYITNKINKLLLINPFCQSVSLTNYPVNGQLPFVAPHPLTQAEQSMERNLLCTEGVQESTESVSTNRCAPAALLSSRGVSGKNKPVWISLKIPGNLPVFSSNFIDSQKKVWRVKENSCININDDAVSGLQPRQRSIPEVLIDEINRLLPHPVVATEIATQTKQKWVKSMGREKKIEINDTSLDQHVVQAVHLPPFPFPYLVQSLHLLPEYSLESLSSSLPKEKAISEAQLPPFFVKDAVVDSAVSRENVVSALSTDVQSAELIAQTQAEHALATHKVPTKLISKADRQSLWSSFTPCDKDTEKFSNGFFVNSRAIDVFAISSAPQQLSKTDSKDRDKTDQQSSTATFFSPIESVGCVNNSISSTDYVNSQSFTTDVSKCAPSAQLGHAQQPQAQELACFVDGCAPTVQDKEADCRDIASNNSLNTFHSIDSINAKSSMALSLSSMSQHPIPIDYHRDRRSQIDFINNTMSSSSQVTTNVERSSQSKHLLQQKNQCTMTTPVQGNLLFLIRQSFWEESCSYVNHREHMLQEETNKLPEKNTGISNKVNAKSTDVERGEVSGESTINDVITKRTVRSDKPRVSEMHLVVSLPIRTIINPQGRNTSVDFNFHNFSAINKVCVSTVPVNYSIHPLNRFPSTVQLQQSMSCCVNECAPAMFGSVAPHPLTPLMTSPVQLTQQDKEGTQNVVATPVAVKTNQPKGTGVTSPSSPWPRTRAADSNGKQAITSKDQVDSLYSAVVATKLHHLIPHKIHELPSVEWKRRFFHKELSVKSIELKGENSQRKLGDHNMVYPQRIVRYFDSSPPIETQSTFFLEEMQFTKTQNKEQLDAMSINVERGELTLSADLQSAHPSGHAQLPPGSLLASAADKINKVSVGKQVRGAVTFLTNHWRLLPEDLLYVPWSRLTHSNMGKARKACITQCAARACGAAAISVFANSKAKTASEKAYGVTESKYSTFSDDAFPMYPKDTSFFSALTPKYTRLRCINSPDAPRHSGWLHMIQRVDEYSLKEFSLSRWIKSRKRNLKYIPLSTIDFSETISTDSINGLSMMKLSDKSRLHYGCSSGQLINTTTLRMRLANKALITKKKFYGFQQSVLLSWFLCHVSNTNFDTSLNAVKFTNSINSVDKFPLTTQQNNQDNAMSSHANSGRFVTRRVVSCAPSFAISPFVFAIDVFVNGVNTGCAPTVQDKAALRGTDSTGIIDEINREDVENRIAIYNEIKLMENKSTMSSPPLLANVNAHLFTLKTATTPFLSDSDQVSFIASDFIPNTIGFDQDKKAFVSSQSETAKAINSVDSLSRRHRFTNQQKRRKIDERDSFLAISPIPEFAIDEIKVNSGFAGGAQFQDKVSHSKSAPISYAPMDINDASTNHRQNPFLERDQQSWLAQPIDSVTGDLLSESITPYSFTETSNRNKNILASYNRRELREYRKKKPFPGQLVAYGESLTDNFATTESGQILYVDSEKVALRKAQTVLIYSQSIIAVPSGEWIEKGTPLMALSYQKLVTGDIVQGLPKIEQFFEAPLLKDGTFWGDSLQAKLNQFFQAHREQLPLGEAVRKGFSEIQRVLVEGVQRVYISQGVLIADKHVEVIVRQMTCKGRILYSGDTGFLRNELVSLEKIESVNQVTYGQKALYHPQVRGITDASLESESFLSAASFQETTRVLSRDAVIGKTDLMRGLKERVIVGELVQAGTGLSSNTVYHFLPS